MTFFQQEKAMQNIIKNNCKIKFIVIIYKKYKQ